MIRKSATLEKLWKHGICTVDKLDISAAAARYCTKYAAKDTRTDDTFMLFSRDIGTQWLMEHFNGLHYQVDGRLFPVPKTIFNKQVEKHFAKTLSFKNMRINAMFLGKLAKSGPKLMPMNSVQI